MDEKKVSEKDFQKYVGWKIPAALKYIWIILIVWAVVYIVKYVVPDLLIWLNK